MQQNDNLNSDLKYSRILYLYTKLLNGEIINKAYEAEYFNVSTRSIQRDIDDLRAFFENSMAEGKSNKELVYDRKINGYYLKVNENLKLNNSEAFALCKIILESRAFRKDEITPMIYKIISGCVPAKNQKNIKALLSNELFHYVEPQHKKSFINSMWDIAIAVKEQRIMKISYQKLDFSVVERIVKPVGIMFSEYYFYLTAFIENIDKEKEFKNKDDIFPTIYRIDRIKSFEITKQHFEVPYKERFEEGEFRKRIQFMYGGKLRKIKFRYKGINPEAVLDRLPTAKIIEKSDDGYIITAEVFGNGIDMWLRSQGDYIEIVE